MKHSVNPSPVPKRFAGRWIAWDQQHTRIIASGATFSEARRRAIESGERQPLLAKVPNADTRFVGAV
jgi:hypothetical protein